MSGRYQEYVTRTLQFLLLMKRYPRACERLIVYLTPGYDKVNGGILAISSMYADTVKLKRMHGAEVTLCTMPGDPPLLRYSKFKNDNFMYTFSQVLSYFRNVRSMLIHVPTVYVDQFLTECSPNDQSRLKRVRDLHVNILIMNIRNLASEKSITRLMQLGKVTCTTAHERYSTPELGRRLGIPLYKISNFANPDLWHRKAYAEKESLMVVSPDEHPRKGEILCTIADGCPQTKIVLIHDMKYEKYKEVIGRAKWSLTFGEGLDGYFVENIFSGGISFSVYNEDFFTEDFRNLRTVYPGYDFMARSICGDIKFLDNEENYMNYQAEQYELCRKHYDYQGYVRNLQTFYRCEFTMQLTNGTDKVTYASHVR